MVTAHVEREPSFTWMTLSCPPRSRFEEYKRTRDPKLRTHLVEGHLNIAYAVARRFIGRGEDLEDLKQVALLALVQAVDRFDPSFGVTFASFAIPTIMGSLKRHFRDRGWAVRPPRPVQERYLAIAGFMETLTQTLGRSPTIAEIAARGNWSDDEVHEALDAASIHRRHRSWHVDPDHTAREPAGVDPEFSRAENRRIVEELLGDLPARERAIIRMRFYEGLSQSTIGGRLGISQMQVSRLLACSMARLRVLATDRGLSSE